MPSENVDTSILAPGGVSDPGSDRRGRKRAARLEALLEQAADIVAEHGVDGLTMAALADAADYAPASLYTYFPSRSSLVAALQQRALAVLGVVAAESVAGWDVALTAEGAAEQAASLARLWGFTRLFLSAPDHHPREFMLQQQLLVSPDAEDVADAALVVPVAMTVLEVPRQLLCRARQSGALDGDAHNTSPIGDELEVDLLRTLSWITSLNGALLTDRLSTGLPTTGALLGTDITRALLIGWGASPEQVEAARQVADDLQVPAVTHTADHKSNIDTGAGR